MNDYLALKLIVNPSVSSSQRALVPHLFMRHKHRLPVGLRPERDTGESFPSPLSKGDEETTKYFAKSHDHLKSTMRKM